VAPAAARLGPEARRVRGQAQRKIGGGNNAVARHAGQGDFRRGDQVLVFARQRVAAFVDFGVVVFAALGDEEHIVFELGQLAGAVQRGTIDDVRRVALGVAVLAGL